MVLKHLAESNRSWELERDELERLQRKKLARTVRLAYAHVPYYHSMLKKAGKHPSDIQKLEDLKKLPTMSKGDVIANYREGITAKGMRPAMTWATTGTTGQPLQLEWTKDADDIGKALTFRKLLKFGVRPWTKLATIWPPKVAWRFSYDPSGRKKASARIYELPFTNVLGGLIPTARIIVSDPDDPDEEVKALNDFRPRFLRSTPRHLRSLGRSVESGKLKIRLKGILLTGEDVSSQSRKELRETYGTKICRLYGTTETGGLGGDCLAQTGMHLNEDYTICEVLKGEEPVGPGEVGELVVTTTHNDIMPLVRYRLGDLVKTADSGKCECGSSMVRVSSIQGRRGDGLKTMSGERVPPLTTVEAIESSTPLRSFQVKQVRLDELVMRVSGRDAEIPGLREKIEELLADQIGAKVRVSFEVWEDQDVWGKPRTVVGAA
jgi:phenylacetate-CoA ligase